MKNYNFPILLMLSMLVFSCRPEAFKEIGTANNNLSALTGTWQIVKVLQTDADAQKKGFPYQTMDLTNVFPYTEFKMTFNTSANAPTTFTVTPGNAPRIIPMTSGNWKADNVEAPKVLTLTSGTESSIVTLGSYPTGANPNLKLRQERKDPSGKVLIIYDYEFKKVN